MNQIHQTQSFAPAPKVSKAPETPNGKPAEKPQPKPEHRLTKNDARALHAMLVQGDEALARRRDLGDMYKRILEAITTLDTGLTQRQTERSDQDRALLAARLEDMESAVNSVEGVLRVEMEPLLRDAVNSAVASQLTGGSAPRQRRPLSYRFAQVFVLCGCVYAGAAFSDQVKSATTQAGDAIFRLAASGTAILSPNGGIGADQNTVD